MFPKREQRRQYYLACMLQARDEAKLSEQFGLRLAQLREEQKLSIRGAAKKIGIGPTRLMSLEQGRDQNTGKPTLPSPSLTADIARAYHIPKEQLLVEAGYLPWQLGPQEAAEATRVLAELLASR